MSRSRIVIVGAGFAEYRPARTPTRPTRHQADFADIADITLLHPTDYFLYPPRRNRRGWPVPSARPRAVRKESREHHERHESHEPDESHE